MARRRALVWTANAADDLRVIIRFIARDNPPAVVRLRNLIHDAVLTLPAHPNLYRAGRVDGTREMVVHPNYIVVYCVRPDRVEIVAVLHARRRYP